MPWKGCSLGVPEGGWQSSMRTTIVKMAKEGAPSEEGSGQVRPRAHCGTGSHCRPRGHCGAVNAGKGQQGQGGAAVVAG